MTVCPSLTLWAFCSGWFTNTARSWKLILGDIFFYLSPFLSESHSVLSEHVIPVKYSILFQRMLESSFSDAVSDCIHQHTLFSVPCSKELHLGAAVSFTIYVGTDRSTTMSREHFSACKTGRTHCFQIDTGDRKQASNDPEADRGGW